MNSVQRTARRLLAAALTLTLGLAAAPVFPAAAAQTTTRYEAENAQNPDGFTVGAGALYSGGQYAGNTGRKGFVFTNVRAANRITMCHTTIYSGVVTIYLLNQGTYEAIGSINFKNTASDWSQRVLQTVSSTAVYIPAGATVKLVPDNDTDIDYFDFTAAPAMTEAEVPAGTVLAKNSTLSAGVVTQEDMMALVGTSVRLTRAGQQVTFAVPRTDANALTLCYRAATAVPARLTIDGVTSDVTLPATAEGRYATATFADRTAPAGSAVTVALAADTELYLDYAAFIDKGPVAAPAAVTLPARDSERVTVDLNGTWECTPSLSVTDPAQAAVPSSFDNTIPVPGFWDLASNDMGS